MNEDFGLVVGYGLMLLPGMALVVAVLLAGALVAGARWAWRLLWPPASP